MKKTKPPDTLTDAQLRLALSLISKKRWAGTTAAQRRKRTAKARAASLAATPDALRARALKAAETRRRNHPPKKCSLCKKPARAKGLCAAHYAEGRRVKGG